MNLFTFQKHFITKMNKRRMVFKLNKLRKYLKSSGLPQELYHHKSVLLRTFKSIEILDYSMPLPSFPSLVMSREQSVRICVFFPKSSNNEVFFLNVFFHPVCFQSYLHLWAL